MTKNVHCVIKQIDLSYFVATKTHSSHIEFLQGTKKMMNECQNY